MLETPDVTRYFEPTGAVDRAALARVCAAATYPTQSQSQGFFSFGTEAEINAAFASVGKFAVKHEVGLLQFVDEGLPACELKKQDASNMVLSMFRQAWDRFCRERGLLEYQYSKSIGFHASKDMAKIGQKIPWRRQGEQRSSMLRNIAKNHVWQCGVSGLPAFWPFPHFKLKSRVLFASIVANEAGDPLDDAKKQHRLRRTVCKGWRNKQWHGRLLAFLELLSGEAPYLSLPLGETAHIRLEPSPMLFASPVSTFLPDQLTDEQEKEDDSTLRRPEPEEEPDAVPRTIARGAASLRALARIRLRPNDRAPQGWSIPLWAASTAQEDHRNKNPTVSSARPPVSIISVVGRLSSKRAWTCRRRAKAKRKSPAPCEIPRHRGSLRDQLQ